MAAVLCGQTQTLALPENVRLLKAAGVVFQHVCVMLMLHGASAEPQPRLAPLFLTHS